MRGSIQKLGADYKPVRKGERPLRFRAFYRDALGRNIAKVFRTKADADHWLKEQAADEIGGALSDSKAGRQTVAALWEEFHASKLYAANTLASHEDVWRRAKPIIGHLRLSKVTPAKVEQVLATFPKPTMRDKARSHLSTLFSYAVAKRMLTVNPARKVKVGTTRAEKKAQGSDGKVDRVLTEEELARLIAEFDRDERTRRYVGLVKLMSQAGTRPGEAYALKIKDFDPLNRRLRVERSIHGDTKTGEVREVPLATATVEILTQHIAKYSEPRNRDALIFSTREGEMLTLDGFRSVFQNASKRADVNHGLTPNHLRHVAVARAIDAGLSIYRVQRMVGHKRASLTLDVYGFLWERREQAEGVDKLDQAIRAAEQIRPTEARVVELR